MREKIVELLKCTSPGIDCEQKDLVDSGVLDSVALMSIISEMEEMEIVIPYEEITPQNFNSVDAIVALAEKYI